MKPLKGFFTRVVDQIRDKAILASLVVLLAAIATQAQNEANNWVFGNNAGLNFSTGSPVSFSGAAINTLEGSSSISDQSGQLLFYTDGRTVWNRNHQQMPNGFGLLGGSSATQSALIVPRPGSECRQYFIFTVDEMGPQKQQKLSYSVVDMNQAGGLGDVTIKNTLLKTDVSEKLAAVRDAAGTGFWVVAHGFKQPSPANPNPSVNREFYAYQVTAATTGTNLVGTEVTSIVGTAHQNSSGTQIPSAGQMKISPNGTLIACAVNTAFVEILNFDNGITNGGAVTQGPPRTFSPSTPKFQSHSVNAFYGLEFSPNSQLLYVSTLVAPSKLFQIDFTLSNPATLLATGAATSYDIAQLQRGPDNKVYVSRNTQPYISVISSPDNPCGTSNFCNFTANGPTLPSGASSQLGLPTMIGGNFSCAPTPTPTPTPIDPCCPPWNQTLLQNMMVYQGSGAFSAPYTLHFQPNATHNGQMYGYINYLHLINPAITAITIDWSLFDQGTGANAIPPGTQIGPTGSTTWTQGGSGNPPVTNHLNFFSLPASTGGFPMQVGTWYLIDTRIHLDNGQFFFGRRCSVSQMWARIQVLPRVRGEPTLEISDGKKIVRRIPIRRVSTQ